MKTSHIVAIVVACILLPFVLWAGSVALSDVFGRGEQIKNINDATNRTFVYQHFFDLDATIRTQAYQADAARKALEKFEKQYPVTANEPFNISELRSQKEQTVTALEQQCVANVEKYNNDAQQFTQDKFLSNKLPVSFDPKVATDPTLLPPSASSR